MSTVHIPLSRRQELCNAEVTLDGRRAVICGYRNEFATVTTLPDGPRYEWSWATVDHIVTNKGGQFRS